MKAWRQHTLGDPLDVLAIEEVPVPEPGPGQVLVRVGACAINFPDALYARGQYQERPELPFTPGLEVAGVVEAVGEGVHSVHPGQRVAAMPAKPWGGLADGALAAEASVFPVPDTMDDISASCLIITYQTGWFGLFHRARLQAGETVLVHAGAGGVGSAAIQLAKSAEATVIATAGGPEKAAICRQLGADHAIDYLSDDFVAAVKDLTGGRGVDVVYDPVGGDTFDRSRKVIGWEGRLVVVGFTSGRIAEVPTNHVLLKNYAVVGVHWGAYFRHDPALVHHCHAELLKLWGVGRIRPLVREVVPFAEGARAIDTVSGRGSWGKVVVTP